MIYWIIHLLILSLFSYLGFRFIKSEIPSIIYWISLFLKLIAGIILGHIFFEYYGHGDTIGFFEAAKNPNYSMYENNPRVHFFLVLIRPIVFSTNGSYWLSSLWISFIGFIPCWFATNIISRLFPSIKTLVITCFLFIPSVVFWSSGIMKDTLIFGNMMILIALILKFYKTLNLLVSDYIIIIISAFILLQLKHYLFITVLIFGVVLVSITLFKKLNGYWKFIIPISVFIVAIGTTQFVHPYLKINHIAWTLYENNKIIYQKSNTRDRIDLVIENDSMTAIIKKIPKALHIGLLRPNIFDQTPFFGWIHRIENFILGIMMSFSLFLSLKLRPKIEWIVFITGISCILLLMIMLPLSSPNFGTLVRYKNAYMPYLFLICSILPYQYLTSKKLD